MRKNNKPDLLSLRQKAEDRLNTLSMDAGKDFTHNVTTSTETLKLIHELEVHQVQLEMQNEELILAKEQATLASEKYMELYDSAPTGYFTLSPAGEIIELNPAGAAMLGKTRSQLINRLFHIFVSDNSKLFFLHFLQKIISRGKKESCELTLSINNDIPKYVYITGIVSKNDGNCLITLIDITERKLLESSVVERMILQTETEKAGKIGGWSINVKTLIQNWTLETFNILEIDTTMGTPQVTEGIGFIDKSFRQTAEIAIKRAIQFGEPFEQVWKLTTAKGNKRWVNVVGKTKIVRGKTTGLFGSIQDITEHKIAEDQLKESQLLLKASIESPKDMIVLSIDKQYNYLFFNTYHKNVMLGAYGKDIKIGMNLLDCISNEDDRLKSKINYERALNGESHTTIEEYGELNRYYYETRYNPILNELNEVIGATAFSSNITERIRAEKQIERLNRVYTVLSSINKTIIRVRNKQLLYEEACRIAVKIGGFKMAWIGIVNSATNKIDVVASFGKTGEYLNNLNIDLNDDSLNSGPAGRAIESGKYNFSNNIQTDDRTFYWREIALDYGFRSVIALPFIVWGKTIGVYMIYSGEIDFFNEDEIKLLEEMASDISYAIEFIESDTERKQAEKSLQESELKYHNIFNNVQDVFYQTDLAGIVLDVSPSIRNFSGFNREDIVGKLVTNSYYDPNDRIKILDLLMEKGELRDYELRLKSLTGEIKYTSINARLIFDSEGKPNHIDGAIRDITERKLAELLLQEKTEEIEVQNEEYKQLNEELLKTQKEFEISSKNFENIFTNSPIGIFVIDIDNEKNYIINSSNPVHEKLLGIKNEKVKGQPLVILTELFSNEVYVYVKNLYDKIVKTKETINFEENLIICNIPVQVNTTIKPLIDENGKVYRLIGTNIDITELKQTEKELIAVKEKAVESEERFKLAMKASKDGLFDWNLETNDIYYAPGWKRIIGYKDYELPNDFSVWEQTTDPLDVKKSWELHQKLITKQIDRFVLEFKMKHKDGHWVDILSQAKAIFNEDGKAIRIVGTHTDISERKKAEEALRESSRLLVESQAVAHIGAYVIELTATEFEANTWKATPEIYKIFGIDETYPHTIAGWAGFIHPDSREELSSYHFQVVAERKRFDHEYKIIRINDGVERWVHGTGELEYDNQHNPIRMLGTIQDITERKLSEAELIEKEVQFRNLSNSGLALIWTSGTDKLCNYFNEKWLSFTGRKLEQEMGNGWATGVHPDDFDRCVETYSTAFDKQEPFEMEYRLLHVSGEYRWLLDLGSPNYKSTGEFIGYIGNCFDITDRKRTEEALRKSEAIKRKIVSNIGDVIVIIDQNGINRYKSPNIETLFGWKPEDLVGKSTWNLVHPDDLGSSQKIFAKIALIPNATETAEIRYMRKDGEYVWIEITIVNLLSDPDIQGFLGNYHEITDRRLAQAKIREKDLEFKKLSSNLPDLIFQFTRKPDGTYCVPIASEGIKNIFGCWPEEVINDFTPIGRVIHPDDVEKVIADIEYSANHLTYFTCEFRVQIPGKPIQWIYSKSSPEKLPDGSVTWYGFNADITERKRVEDSIVKLKTAIDKSEISVVITDNNGNIEYANPFFTKLTGYSQDEYIGKTPNILNSAYHPKDFYQELWNTINSGKTWEGEIFNRKKNGEMYWENAIISPVTNRNNEITNFVAIKTDITHAKNINAELIIAKEHAEESDRLKSAFLANMSHEIRTPMNGILGFTELLKEPDLADDQRKYFVSIIEKSGARLLNIINDIIDISKIESGLMKVKKSGINVNEYLDQILIFFNPEAEAKNIKLICKPGLSNEEAIVTTDSEKFYAILVNLVKNALKYTETGFVEFGYCVAETQNIASLHATSPPSHSYMQFYIKDTGIGIPKNRQEAIFERFVQADILDKMARQGAGLGLSISKAYVEMIGGNIWLESEEENLSAGKKGGSTFYFTLPIHANPESENTVKITNPAKDVQPELSGLKIIIAEDDESSSTFISIGVRKFGKEVIMVQTGREAVEACRNNPDIDLILMDIQMPEMSGYEATRQIRQFNSEVIIIALTAFALAGDREKAIEAGCNDYISKPVKMAELVEMIKKYFKS